MAIKRSLYKPECTELLDAMSSKEVETRVVSNYVQQSKEECRIVNGHLLHRLQSAYTCYHPSIDWQFRDLSSLMHICPHFSFRENIDKIGKGVQRCGKCRTEYSFNIEDHGINAHIILVTKWKDLGTDLECDAWRQHLRFPQRSLSKIRQAFILHTKSEITEECQVEDVWSEIGDLPSVFGDSDHFQYDSLFTKENKAALLWHRKRL
ncbi:hypothetical protein B0O99DRAFT_522641 [Bisporella sp. PMI_857]|nr:hypothetical protein B0O99DRAFT_522641 [Bisporella sp. PMI_857]